MAIVKNLPHIFVVLLNPKQLTSSISLLLCLYAPDTESFYYVINFIGGHDHKVHHVNLLHQSKVVLYTLSVLRTSTLVVAYTHMYISSYVKTK